MDWWHIFRVADCMNPEEPAPIDLRKDDNRTEPSVQQDNARLAEYSSMYLMNVRM